jgi:hypothetical protein
MKMAMRTRKPSAEATLSPLLTTCGEAVHGRVSVRAEGDEAVPAALRMLARLLGRQAAADVMRSADPTDAVRDEMARTATTSLTAPAPGALQQKDTSR